jgi:hypothetical protein
MSFRPTQWGLCRGKNAKVVETGKRSCGLEPGIPGHREMPGL